MRLNISWLMPVGIAVIAVALVVQVWTSQPAAGFRPAGQIGSLQAVTLVGGEIHFGWLKSEDEGHIVLTNVFDAAETVNPESKARSTQLIRRTTGTMYGPTDLAIPIDNILYTESVGSDSAVAKAMATMEPGAPQAAAGSEKR